MERLDASQALALPVKAALYFVLLKRTEKVTRALAKLSPEEAEARLVKECVELTLKEEECEPPNTQRQYLQLATAALLSDTHMKDRLADKNRQSDEYLIDEKDLTLAYRIIKKSFHKDPMEAVNDNFE